MQPVSFRRLILKSFLGFSLIATLCIADSVPGTKSQQSPKRPLVTTKPLTTIPVEIPSYGLIFLKTRVNNSGPLWFALDSGASFSFVISTSRAVALGMKLESEFESSGGAGEGSYNIKLARGISVGLPGLTLKRQTSAIINLDSIETLAGRHIDGLVGSEIFKDFVVEIDYVEHTVKLYDPKSFNYAGSGVRLALTLEKNYFFVTATLGVPRRNDLPGRFLIDTGGGLVMLVLTTPFVESTNLVSSLGKTIRDDSLSALGGDIKLLVSRLPTIKLGALTIKQPIIHLSQNQSGALASSEFDGIIGAELLKRFRVIFDYSRRRLILEPNVNFSQPCEYNLTGISVRATGEQFKIFTVHKVLENSPSAEAGVRNGDVIVEINDRPAHEFTLDDLYRMSKTGGRALRLRLSRGSETVVATIKPRRMI